MSADSIFPLIQQITPTVLDVGTNFELSVASSFVEAFLIWGLSRVPRMVPVIGAAATFWLLLATDDHTASWLAEESVTPRISFGTRVSPLENTGFPSHRPCSTQKTGTS